MEVGSDARPRRAPWHSLPLLLAIPFAPLAAVTALSLATGYRGGDYPGQDFRAELWRHAPLETWNFRWYGGHSLVEYSVLTPPFASVFTSFGFALVVTALSVAGVTLFASQWWRPWPAIASSTAFGLASSMNVLVGRVTFAFGLLLVIVTVSLWSTRGRLRPWRWIVAPLVGFASPVAAVLLGAIILSVLIVNAMPDKVPFQVGGGPTARRPLPDGTVTARNRWQLEWRTFLLGVAVSVPLIVLLITSQRSPHQPAQFGYTTKMLYGSLVLCAALVVAARWSTQFGRLIGSLGAIGLLITIPLAIFPSPLGGNFVRYTSMLVIPMGVGYVINRYFGSWSRAKVSGRTVSGWAAIVFGVVTIAGWLHYGEAQADLYFAWRGDPSRHRAYFDPLLAALQDQPPPMGRVEIPFTALHTEADVVAEQFALARGWERQVDRAQNAVLYEPDLTPEKYREWATASGVGYVAVPTNPAVRIDFGGEAEMKLLARADQIDWLSEQWRSDGWVLYRVQPDRPRGQRVGDDGLLPSTTWTAVEFDTPTAGSVEVAASYDPRLGIKPAGCLRSGPDGRIIAEVPQPGSYRVVQRPWGVLTDPPPCDRP